MSVNSIVLGALNGFGHPIEQDIYTGTEKHYFVWNYADERASLHTDDAPNITTISIQVHLYVPLTYNYLSEKKQIQKALYDAGFTYPTVPLQTAEEETGLRHIVFECEISESEE